MHSAVVKGRVFFRPGTVRGATGAGDTDASGPTHPADDAGKRRRHQLNVLMPDAETREAARKVVEAFRAQRGRRAIEAALGIADMAEDAPDVLESIMKGGLGVDALEATRTALRIAGRGRDARETLTAIAAATAEPASGAASARIARHLKDPIVREAMAAAAERPELASLLRRLNALPPDDYGDAVSAVEEFVEIMLASPRPRGPLARLRRMITVARSAWRTGRSG